MSRWLQRVLGIDELSTRMDQIGLFLSEQIDNVRRSMAVDRSALVKTLTEIGESGNKIAKLITDLKRANDEGAQNEVNRIVQELAPASDFLRGLAENRTEDAVNEGTVVPDLPPVGGEVAPAQDPATQEAVNEAQQDAGA